MKRTMMGLFAATLFLSPTLTAPAHAEGVRREAAEHPRIAAAIHEMEEAIRYMEAAPHDFGGHKAAAIDATRRAIEELRKALVYRAVQDTRHGK